MCGPGFVGRVAEASDLPGVAAVAAETGTPLLDAERYVAGGRLRVAVSAGDVIGFAALDEPDGGGTAVLLGPAVGAAGFGLGVEKALVRRAVEDAARAGARALRAYVSGGDAVRVQTLVAFGFQRTPEGDREGRSAFTRTL